MTMTTPAPVAAKAHPALVNHPTLHRLADDTFVAAAEAAMTDGYFYGQVTQADDKGLILVSSLIGDATGQSPVTLYVDDAFDITARDSATGDLTNLPQDGQPGHALVEHVRQHLATYTVAAGFATEMAHFANPFASATLATI